MRDEPTTPSADQPRDHLMALIWHLARTADWEQARTSGAYAISTRGLTLAQVGFVHCCHAHQVAGVVALFYADESDPLTLLGIDVGRLAAMGVAVRGEPGDTRHPDGERFPHVYGAIPIDAVVATHRAQVVDGRLVAPTWSG